MERVRNRPKYESHYSVIPASELTALKNRFIETYPGGDKSYRQRAEQEEREILKARSEARVKNWPNTIEALRVKKEADRKKRLEQEEEARKEVDRQEAEYQAAQRKAAIERANLILYEQDDRIKSFNSKMFLSHVLEEREKQVDLKKRKEVVEVEKEAVWTNQLHDQLKKAKIEEKKKEQAIREKAEQTQKDQKAQLQEMAHRVRNARSAAKQEGLEIRAAAEQGILDELEAERQRKLKAQKLANEYREANIEFEKVRQKKREEEAEEEAKIEKFAKIKEEQMAERKRRADEKFRRDLAKRQAMIDRQSEHLKNLHDQAEARLQRQMAFAEEQKEQREKSDSERAARTWKSIQDSRTRQLNMKARKKQMEEMEQANFKNQWAQAAESLLIEEMEVRQGRRDKNKRLLDFQKMQMQEKSSKAMQEKQQERMEGEMMKKALEEEQDMFDRYVNTVMDEYAAKGRNLSAMKTVKSRGQVF